MITLADCRRILGETAKSLSDEEVLKVRDQLRELAELALESRSAGSKNEPVTPLQAESKERN